MPTNDLEVGLISAANLFTEAMKKKLSSGNYPRGNPERGFTSIQNATSIGTVQDAGNGKKMITISIDLNKAPYAGAFEWGSGIHNTKATDKTPYEIRPQRSSALAFMWPEFWKRAFDSPDWYEEWKSLWRSWKLIYAPKDTEGIFLFKWVEHPGIEAQPYIRPTLEATKKDIVELLGDSFVAQILGQLVEYDAELAEKYDAESRHMVKYVVGWNKRPPVKFTTSI